MIVKGIIEDIVSNNKIKVRCPTLDKIPESSISNNNLNVAIICSLPGNILNPKNGDIVFVGFENENFSLPVVLGYLYLNSKIESSSSLNLRSLIVNLNSVLPKYTSIGSINWFELYCLKDLSVNIKEYFNLVNDSIESKKLKVSSILEEIDSIEKEILDINKNINKSNSSINNFIKVIGKFGDTSDKTLFGRLYSISKKLDTINNHLGNFSKDNTLSDKLLELNNLIDNISNYSCETSVVYNDEQNCMLSRAEKMISVTWVPKNTFNKWNSSETFNAGQQYIGMPYTMFSYGYTYDTWKTHAEDNISINGSISGWGDRNGPKYGSCCADFVSEVLGLPEHQRTCSGLANQTDYLIKITGDSAKASNIKVGDVLLASGGHHVMWVGAVSGDTLTIYEQNPPLAHKFTLSISNNTRNGFIFWGELYNTILRPNDKLLSLESNISVDNTSSISDDWVYKGSHYNTDLSKMFLNDSEYLHNALIFWKLCKKAGWSAEAAAGTWSNTYGESSGNPWSYGTAGGGILGYTPFDFGYNGAGIYDYASNVWGDPEKRWDGDVQVGYLNWLVERVKNKTLYKVFSIRKPTSKYWNYEPPANTRIPKTDFDIDVFIKLNKRDNDATATICAKLWLARAGVVDLDFGDRRTEKGLNHVIESHILKAEELYQLFLKY